MHEEWGRRTLGGEVAVLGQRVRLGLDIANRAQFLDERSERVEGGDRPPFDAGNEETVRVAVGSVDKVVRSLLGRCEANISSRTNGGKRGRRTDSDERNALVGRSEPDNTRRLLRRMVPAQIDSLPLPPLRILLLLRRRRRRPEDAEHPAEELSGSALDDRDDVAGELGLLVVVDLLLLEKHETLAFDLDVVLLLVLFADIARRAGVVRGVLLLFALLLLLLLLRSPDLVDLRKTASACASLRRRDREKLTSRSSIATTSPSSARFRSFEPAHLHQLDSLAPR